MPNLQVNYRPSDTREVHECSRLDQLELVVWDFIHVLAEGQSDSSCVRDLAERNNWGFWRGIVSSLLGFLFVLSL